MPHLTLRRIVLLYSSTYRYDQSASVFTVLSTQNPDSVTACELHTELQCPYRDFGNQEQFSSVKKGASHTKRINAIPVLLPNLCLVLHSEKPTPAVDTVRTGNKDISSAFRAERPKVQGVAPRVIEATAPAPGTFGL